MQTFLHKYGIPLAVSLFVIAGVVMWINIKGPGSRHGRLDMGFFLDEETGEESVLPLDELPPLPGKSGNPTVVRAMKFGFQDKDGKRSDERTVYLYKFTQEAKEKLKDLPKDDPQYHDLIFSGQFVRDPQPGSPWVPYNSSKGQEIATTPIPPAGKHVVMISPPK